MKLSTRARYGTRALLDLALHAGDEPVQLKDIAQRQEVSVHYLEHLVAPLIGGGILRSTRGARGGIQLARPASDIKLSEVIQLLEGTISPVECVIRPETCTRSRTCPTRDVWSEMKRAIDGILESTTLQNLVDKQRDKEQSGQAMYYV